MTKKIILNLGNGDFEKGFNQSLIKFIDENDISTGEIRKLVQLPRAPAIPVIYTKWIENYNALLNSSRTGFKTSQVTNISKNENLEKCNEYALSLQENFNVWLHTIKKDLEPFLSLISQDEILFSIQTQKITNNDAKIIIHKLPWHLWDIFPESCFAEATLSTTEQRSFYSNPEQLTSSRLKRV